MLVLVPNHRVIFPVRRVWGREFQVFGVAVVYVGMDERQQLQRVVVHLDIVVVEPEGQVFDIDIGRCKSLQELGSDPGLKKMLVFIAEHVRVG